MIKPNDEAACDFTFKFIPPILRFELAPIRSCKLANTLCIYSLLAFELLGDNDAVLYLLTFAPHLLPHLYLW